LNDSRLKDRLAASETLDPASLDQALGFAKSRNMSLAKALVELGLLPEVEAWKHLAKAVGLPFVDPGAAKIPERVLSLIPRELIEENRALPVVLKGNTLFIAIDDPERTWVLDNLGFMLEQTLKPALAPPSSFDKAMQRFLGSVAAKETETTGAQAAAGDEGDDAPIIRLVQKTIEEALEQRASDIHIEPYADHVRVRYRIDGVLHDAARHPKNLQGPLTSRLKIMAALDIAEKRKPQDGRIQLKVQGREIDIRTAVLPSNHGETLVLRLLDKEKSLFSLEALGFVGDDFETFQRVIKRPNGIFLVTGPTGSGKTTTLYAALRELNKPDVKIITAEDPVEYNLSGINQCQVRRAIGLTFAKILRAMLRQAPNIILVGEIRDSETAEIAIQAALTGHLVFSTLHTNDAPSAISRLADMGVKPFLIAASIQAVLAQRLVRLLCPACKQAYEPSEQEIRSIGLDPSMVGDQPFFEAKGCEACSHTGYMGRKGIFELMRLDDEMREMIFRGEPTLRLRDYAEKRLGMRSLLRDGANKVVQGQTSVQEILRVVASE
jgi:type IV pilus assembly protein PilB